MLESRISDSYIEKTTFSTEKAETNVPRRWTTAASLRKQQDEHDRQNQVHQSIRNDDFTKLAKL